MREAEYFSDLRKTAEKLKGFSSEVALIFHDDADGLCAGAIASLALDRLKVAHELLCVEKLSPEIVKLIHSRNKKLYIYLDIGSGRADLIAEQIRRSGGEAIIADHHDPVEVECEGLIHLNPELYGYSGETEVSGSTATYLLMREACALRDAAWMAVVGSAEIPGLIRGLNKTALEDAIKEGDVEIIRRGNSEKYLIKFLKKPWNRVSSTLTAIGSTGYYENGPYEAVKHLKVKKLPEELAKRLEELRKKKISQALAIISKKGLNANGFVQWFHLGDLFRGLGSKTVGTLTSMLSYRRIVDPKKYLIGFMNFESQIPRLGELEGKWAKASVRAPKLLSDLIRKKVMPPISDLTVKAAEEVGGTGDGHAFAASALIPAGKESDFIKKFNESISSLKPERGSYQSPNLG